MATHKKIAVLGGSFNPVHYGHISLARNVAATCLVDEVWLSLSPKNPFKDKAMLMAPGQRLEMLREAVAPFPEIKATDIELTLPEPSYTVDALDAMAGANPDCRFTLLIGSDNLPGFTKWKNWEEILERYGVIVYPRGEADIQLPEDLQPYAHRITLLADMPLYAISSTQLREGQNPPHP